MFFFIFYGLQTFVTFDTSIRGDQSKKFWKENHFNFYMISITQNINFAPCDRFSQITSQMFFPDQHILFHTYVIRLSKKLSEHSNCFLTVVHKCSLTLSDGTNLGTLTSIRIASNFSVDLSSSVTGM